MSEFNIEVEGGSSVRLRTAGKYCDRDIVVTASGGGSEGGSDLAKLIDRSITEIRDDSVTSIGNYALSGCPNLTTADFPAVTSIGNYALSGCPNLTTADFPAVTSIGNYALSGCSNLTTADFPAVTSIGNNAFNGCSNLTTADFPAVTSIGNNAFTYCSALTTVNFRAVTSIGSNAFYGCSALTTLILRNTERVATLFNTGAFTRTPIADGTGYIYVPSAMVESYKAASNWSNYANQIRAIEDYPDICGG